MKRSLTLMIAVLAALSAATAPAAANTFKSELVIGGTSNDPEEGLTEVHGSIETSKRACLSHRTVRTFGTVSGEQRKPLTPDRSSENGYWGGSGEVGGEADSWSARLLPKRLGKNGRCSGSRDSELRPAVRAHRRATYTTELQYFTAQYGGSPRTGATGVLHARKSCLPGRRVDIFALTDGQTTKAADDVSSKNGYWGAFGRPGGDGIEIRIRSRKLKNGNRCGPASYSYEF